MLWRDCILLTPAKGAPRPYWGTPSPSAECLSPPGGAKRPPQEKGAPSREVSSSGSGSTQPPRVGTHHRAPPRRRPPLPAVRPAGPGGWRRPGRLHAPEAARTGPVSASRRYLSWSPRGRRVNGQNGHFSCQAGRNHVGTPPGRYGSGFNGPRAAFLLLPIDTYTINLIIPGH